MKIWIISTIIIGILGCGVSTSPMNNKKSTVTMNKTEEEWKAILTDQEFHVMRTEGTERSFSGEYWDHFKEGSYHCKGCDQELFNSNTKFDAHCGWPSFYDVFDEDRITKTADYKLGYKRIEISCAQCGCHLGHVFDDGPAPTGKRYCINSISLSFEGEE